MFQLTFCTIINDDRFNESFKISLHCTNQDLLNNESQLNIKKGRANLDSEFENIRSIHPNEDIIGMVCGPVPMVEEVSRLTLKYKMHFHPETFEL